MFKKIFIIAGGTGGHIIPGRCLASQLALDGLDVTFFGDKKIVSYIKKTDNFSSKIIHSSQIRKEPLLLAQAAFNIAVGVLQSLYFILRFRPKYIVAFGGYATFPLLAAAIATKTPIILHEQNSHLGKVNRIFTKYAQKIALSFVETSGISAENLSKTVFVGNPVRDEILQLNKVVYTLPINEEQEIRTDNKMGYDLLLASDFHEKEAEKKLFNILIIGGSGGAKIFSEVLPKAFFNLRETLKENIHITQQCRQELMKQTFEQYRSYNINIVIDSFFQNMPELIAASHLVIARSGSSSIFEFCAAKKPMVLIPFALSADNHQEKNARYLENHGAAIVVPEIEFTINKVTDLLKNLIDNHATLKKMSENAASLAVLDATTNLAKLVK
jgi:UDP-N-acetylglucosamine--N-acetylmuramyl-(pentapeptide) pyrophosphoryl-undecaprenol N-acetylglucosamine transferase